MAFEAPKLFKEDLRGKAEQFLAKENPQREIPVPIELIVEKGFGIDIIPVPGLQSVFDVVAFLSKDMKDIRVDEYVYKNRNNRYKFSLAHELAHRLLHEEFYREAEFTDIESWKDTVATAKPEREYGYMEYHANCFAGLVLVPPKELQEYFRSAMNVAASNGIDTTEISDASKDIVESYIARFFEVSRDVVHKRIEDDGLWLSVT